MSWLWSWFSSCLDFIGSLMVCFIYFLKNEFFSLILFLSIFWIFRIFVLIFWFILWFIFYYFWFFDLFFRFFLFSKFGLGLGPGLGLGSAHKSLRKTRVRSDYRVLCVNNSRNTGFYQFTLYFCSAQLWCGLSLQCCQVKECKNERNK